MHFNHKQFVRAVFQQRQELDPLRFEFHEFRSFFFCPDQNPRSSLAQFTQEVQADWPANARYIFGCDLSLLFVRTLCSFAFCAVLCVLCELGLDMRVKRLSASILGDRGATWGIILPFNLVSTL